MMSTLTVTHSMAKRIKAGKLSRDMSFEQKAWALTARIPKGKVVSYGQIAAALDSRAYRAVGRAMHDNPYAPAVPCHRVVGSDGSLTGFGSGLDRKEKMLAAEGVATVNGRVDLAQHQYVF